MSTYTGRSHGPQGQYKTAGNRHGDVCPQAQQDGEDCPFPNKPVSHRRSFNSKKQDAFELHDLEKMTITKQPGGKFSPQKHHSDDIRKTTRSQDPRKDSQPSGELQIDRAIHAKKIILQEKLWGIEEKLRNKVQGDDTGLPEQKREPVRRREHSKDRMRNTHEEEMDRGERKSHRGAHQITAPELEEQGGLNKSRWENIKEHTRRKGGDKKDHGVKSQDGTVKERRYTTTVYTSDHEPGIPQKRQVKTSHRAATEDPRGAGRTASDRPQHGQLTQEERAHHQLLPCTICKRTFTSDRLQKHVQICEKQKPRQVFNSYFHRTKGSAIERFWKNQGKPPEENDRKPNHKINTRTLHKGQLTAGNSQPGWSK